LTIHQPGEDERTQAADQKFHETLLAGMIPLEANKAIQVESSRFD
jgi:hypothetical protein